MNEPVRRRREHRITTALVLRVINRVENGIPVRIAIGGEGVTLGAYRQYLREHPKLEALQEGAKRKFMEQAVTAILGEEKPGAAYRWLLTNCHPDLLAQANDDAPVETRQTMAGVPEEVVEYIRERAANWRDYPEPHHEDGSQHSHS
ncbi:MAG: hypothetical protein ACRED1_03070 [Limisphaerales bacterium]